MVQSIKMYHFSNYRLTFFLLVSVMFISVVIGQPDYAPSSQCTIGRPANCLEMQFKVPGDSLGFANGVVFVTRDKNDVNGCSKTYKGGCWYMNCHSSNLNGLYLNGAHESYANGVNWGTWSSYHFSMKKTEIKVRPKRLR